MQKYSIILVLLSLTTTLFSGNKIKFDKTTSEDFTFYNSKGTIQIYSDSESKSHFYVVFIASKDTMKCRFYTKEKSIILNGLENLERNRKIQKDGLCTKNINGLYSELYYSKGRLIKESIYYPNGTLWASITNDKFRKKNLHNTTIATYTQITKEYYETGEIKREEEWTSVGEVLSRKNYTKEGKDTLFHLPFRRAPYYPEGIEKLITYIQKNIRYPKSITQPGVVVIEFFVEKDGSLSDMKIIRSHGHEADKEVYRVLNEISDTPWIPAVEKGELVRQKIGFPIRFDLGDIRSLLHEENARKFRN